MMTLQDLIKPGTPLEADGQITIYEIESGKVVAEYAGLEVHEKLDSYKKFEFSADSFFGMVMGSICIDMCAHCGEVPHVTVDDDVRCCLCGND